MSMGIMDSRPAIFTVEFPDGPVYTGKAVGVTFTTDQPAPSLFEDGDSYLYDGLFSWEIELQGVGDLTMMTGNGLAEVMEKQRAAPEWKCPYCGRTWPRSRHKCWDGANGCGASRPAVYGL